MADGSRLRGHSRRSSRRLRTLRSTRSLRRPRHRHSTRFGSPRSRPSGRPGSPLRQRLGGHEGEVSARRGRRCRADAFGDTEGIMITREQLQAWGPTWQLNPPATLAQVESAQAAVGLRFPEEYAAFLRAADGMTFLRESLPALGLEEYALLSCQEVVRHNHDFDVLHRAPGRLIVGRMGGEGPIFLHLAQGTEERAP